MTYELGLGLVVALVFLLTRLAPTYLAGLSGVDVWYHLLCAREMRRQRRVDPDLKPYLVFEPTSRYPPLLAAILSIFPESFLRRRSVWVGVSMDAIQLMLLFDLTRGLLGVHSALLASAIYAVHPTLGLEYSSLSPRSLASLFVTGFFLSLYGIQSGMGVPAFALAVTFFGIVLVTNKQATQLLLVASVAGIVVDPRFLLIPPAGALFAIALSGGHYLRVLESHKDILTFWRTRMDMAGAHQVLESTPYLDSTRVSTRSFLPGTRGFVRLCRALLAHDPFLPFVGLAWGLQPSALSGAWAVWLVSVYLCAFATTFLKPLRFLGEGYRYLKFAAFAEAFFLANAAAELILVLPFAASLYVGWRLLKSRPLETTAPGFADLVTHLTRDRTKLAVFPAHLANRLALETGSAVLWGGHSSGYESLTDWVPVLKSRVDSLLRAEGADALVVDTRYMSPDVLGPGFLREQTFGSYALLRLRAE